MSDDTELHALLSQLAAERGAREKAEAALARRVEDVDVLEEWKNREMHKRFGAERAMEEARGALKRLLGAAADAVDGDDASWNVELHAAMENAEEVLAAKEGL